MTAPTPDLEPRLRALSLRATDGGMYEANETLLVADMAAALVEAADALAAVTTERDQARQMLTDAPHGYYCLSRTAPPPDEPRFPCDCWKAEL